MKLTIITVSVLLVALGIALTTGADESTNSQDLKKKYPLLARLDIPTDSLPKGCTKPDLQPDDFPLEGLRQCAIITDSLAITAMDKRATKVGANNIDAMYYAIYKEAGELGVVGFAFNNSQVAKNAYENLIKDDDGFRTWLRGKYVIRIWRDIGTTDECMQQMAAIIERIIQFRDKNDKSAFQNPM